MSTTVQTNDGYFVNGGPYWAYNNTWGAGSLEYGIDYTQTITVESNTFPFGTTLAWSFPNSGSPDGIWAYPEVVYGASAVNGWYGTNGTDQPFQIPGIGGGSPAPTQIDDLNLIANYSVTLAGNTQAYDVIFDTYLTPAPPNGASTVKDQELEFTVYANPPLINYLNTQCTLLFTLSNGDEVFSNYGGKIIGILPAGGAQLSGTVDFTDIFSELIAHGLVNPNDYLSGMELGAEVQSGSGSMTINSLDYQWSEISSLTVASVGFSGAGITNGSGDLTTGSAVTLMLSMTEVATISGGTPSLTLNDGGTATYTGGSGTNALTFSYTVAAGQNTADLTVNAVNLNGASITDSAGNAANLTGTFTPEGTLQIDTTPPTLTSLATSGTGITNGNGDMKAGSVVTLTLTMSEAVTVAVGTPTLTLNDGGTAAYTGGSGTNALTFSYTVAAGQNTADLTVNAVNLNGGTITDGAGNNASLSGTFSPAGTLQIDTTQPAPPTVSEQITSGNRAVLSGTAQTGAVISVYDGTALLGTTSVNTEGDWTFTTSALARGAHTFTATAADAAGNVSASSSPNPAVVVGQSDTSPSSSSQTVGQILDFPPLLNMGAKDGIGQLTVGFSTPNVLAYLQNNIQSGGTLPIADASRCALLGNHVASSLVPKEGPGAMTVPNDLALGSAPVLAAPHHS